MRDSLRSTGPDGLGSRSAAGPRDGERGSILLAALVVTAVAVTLVIGSAYDATMRLRMRADLQDSAMALVCAQAGLENAQRMASTDTTLTRTDVSLVWLSNKDVGPGRVSVSASDPGDGMIASDGGSFSSSADTVRLSATGVAGDVSRSLMADYVRLPHEALKYVVFANKDLGLDGVKIEGRLRANEDVYVDNHIPEIFGDITSVTGKSIDAVFHDADTDTFYAPTSQWRPVPDFQWFKDAGVQVPLPFTRRVSGMILAPGFSNRSAPSAEGIYWINANYGDMSLTNCALEACLAIVNAGTVYISDGYGGTTLYYHHSPDPGRLPALVVDGKLTMRMDYGEASVNMGAGTVTVASGVHGLVYCTEEFWGPQVNPSDPILFEGAIIGNNVHIIGPGTLIRHDPDLNLNPLVEFALSGLRLVPNSRREL